MRLCRFDDGKYGIVVGDQVHDISDQVQRLAERRPSGPRHGDAVIAQLDEIRALTRDVAPFPVKPLADVRLLSPVANPSKLACAPVNYHAHIAEMRADKTLNIPESMFDISKGGLFLKANSALVGASEGVAIRFPDRRNDHELELCVVVGRSGSDIAEADALDCIAGYTLGLDMTLRGSEDRSFRKSIDSYAVLGPWLVTADEIADPADIPFTLHVNGQLRQDANTSDLIWDIPRLIAFASRYYTLHPGDVIFTGAPRGVGPVKPGDVMVAECPLIGRMEVAVRLHQP